MLSNKSGFTLIEILITITIISLSIAIVYPVSVKILDKFENYISKFEEKQNKDKERFERFIRDE